MEAGSFSPKMDMRGGDFLPVVDKKAEGII
jgi:hypothetical protein